MKKILHTLIFALGLGLLAACGNSADNPEKVAETFFKEMLEGDSSKAVNLIYLPPEMQQQGVKEEDVKGKLGMMFAAIREEVAKQGGIDSIKADGVQYTNADKTEATVDITIKPKNGDGETETIPLIKTDKGWKLNMK